MIVFAILAVAAAVAGVVVAFAGVRRKNSIVAMIGLSVAMAASVPAVLYSFIE